MAFPRRIYKGMTVKSTRVTRDRKFLLRPSPDVVQLIEYCIGLAAQQTGVRVHALCWLMNHYHGVFSDPRALFPEFQWWLNRFISIGLNRLYDKSGANWENGSYNIVDLVAPVGDFIAETIDADARADVLGHMDYVELNALRAGLVDAIDEWIGVHTTPNSVGRTTITERPSCLASCHWLPARVEFTITKPPRFDDVCDADFIAMRKQRIEAAERQHREQHGRGIGVVRAMRVNPFDSPRTPPPKGSIEPVVCGKTPEVLRARIRELQGFRRRYRVRLNARRRHDAGVVFPTGTYWQRRFFRENTIDNSVSTDPMPVPSAEQDAHWEVSLS